MIKMAGIWSPLENTIYWISNDSLAKISHNYPYTANTVEPQYNEGQGPGTVNVYSGMASVAYWFRCFSREYPRRQLKLRPEQQQQATLLNAKEIHNTCTFTLCTFRKSYSLQAVWGCYILSQLCINSPCMLILKRFWEWYIYHHFMIMWKKVMVWFVGTRPEKVKIVEEPAVYRSGMWVLLQ